MRGCRLSFVALFLITVVLLGENVPHVVSLSPAMTELICHLGAKNTLVGRSSACDYPPEVRQLPSAGDFALPNLERVLSLQPTLVVSNDLVNPSVVAALKRQKIEVLLFPCRSVQEYLQCVLFLGERLNCQNSAKKECERIQKFLAQCKRQAPTPGRCVAVIWSEPLLIAGEGTFLQELLTLAGCKYVDCRRQKGYFTPSLEWLLQQQPDYLITFPQCSSIEKNRKLQALTAVKKGHIVIFPDETLLQRPGPRWPEGARLLRTIVLQRTRGAW